MQSVSLHFQNFTLAIGHLMRSLLAAFIVLFASTANAQNIWQMNAAYQNQINSAQAAAWPVYAPVYVAPRPYYGRPVYAPVYGGGYYSDDTAFEIRQLNNTLQFNESVRQLDAIRNRPWIR